MDAVDVGKVDDGDEVDGFSYGDFEDVVDIAAVDVIKVKLIAFTRMMVMALLRVMTITLMITIMRRLPSFLLEVQVPSCRCYETGGFQDPTHGTLVAPMKGTAAHTHNQFFSFLKMATLMPPQD